MSTPSHTCHTLPLHDALPICNMRLARLQLAESPSAENEAVLAAEHMRAGNGAQARDGFERARAAFSARGTVDLATRSEEHTSELQSQSNLVCRLLLEKKNDMY